MQNDLNDSKIWLSEFENDGLAYLTPAERVELDQLTKPTRNEFLSMLPQCVLGALLYARKQFKATGIKIDLPHKLLAELNDASRTGKWTGTWTPADEPGFAEIVDWFQANWRRLDTEIGLVEMKNPTILMPMACLLDDLMERPHNSHCWEVLHIVRQLKADDDKRFERNTIA